MTVSNIRLSSLIKAFTRLADCAVWAFAAPHDPLYRMEQDGYHAALEHEVESRFAISNGFLGVRASLEQPTLASRRAPTSPAASTPRPALDAGQTLAYRRMRRCRADLV
jgi:hypothetical protein